MESKISIKDYLMVGIVGLVLVISIIQSFQIRSLKNEITGNVVKISGAIDMSSWSENEKMNYEHHGVLPSRAQGNTQQQSSMVGGC